MGKKEKEEEKEINPMETRDEKIVRLLEENIKLSKQILHHSKKTRHWIFIQKIKGWFYITLIIVPLILAAFYLPPILKKTLEQYRNVWQIVTGVNQSVNSVNLSPSQLEQLKYYYSQQK